MLNHVILLFKCRKDFHNTGVHVTGGCTAVDADTLHCKAPPVVTAGNTTVCIVPGHHSTPRKFPAFQPLGGPPAPRDRDGKPSSARSSAEEQCSETPYSLLF